MSSSAAPLPSTSSSGAPLKPCRICGGASCVVAPSLATPRHLCLLHYYATGAHREGGSGAGGAGGGSGRSSSTSRPATTTGVAAAKRRSSLLVDPRRIERQLPSVQELFAEAFVALRREVGEASARAYEKAAGAEDPLAALLDANAAPSSAAASRGAVYRSFGRTGSGARSKPSSSGMTKKGTTKRAARRRGGGGDHPDDDDAEEGGFLREAVLPERLRRLQQNPRVGLEGYARHNFGVVGDASAEGRRKRRKSGSAATTETAASNPSHRPTRQPPKRRPKPPTNPWNQILDARPDAGTDGTDGRKKGKKTKWKLEDLEREMIDDVTSSGADYGVPSRTCPACGGVDVEVDGSVTSRNDDVRKGEVWGTKDRGEATVVERCRCRSCGKTWNEG